MEKNLSSLELYSELIARIDAYEKRLLDRYGEYISCRPGCHECCILGSVCAVEAYVLTQACAVLADEPLSALSERAGQDNGEACIFLIGGNCSVYRNRPVICRTHGYPLMVEGRVDFCPCNFRGIDSIDSEYILDLEQINTALGVINMRFIGEIRDERFKKERISMVDIVSLMPALKNP